MKKITRNILILSSLATMAVVTPLILKASGEQNVEQEDIVYQTNFENMTISSSSTADINTGFVWAQDWQTTKTVSRNGSNMLEISLTDNKEYAPIGGFGIASASNLSKCKNGEAYTCSCYLEFTNMDHVFVEFVGDKWGSIIIDKNGNVTQNPGGNNLSHVSYENHILTFTFTKTFCLDYNVEGYIQFVGFNASNAKVYFDDIKIYNAKHIIHEDYEYLPPGVFTNESTFFNKIYIQDVDNVKGEYVKENNNTVAKMTYNAKDTSSKELFYLNKLTGLNKDRDYKVSFDYKTTNIDKTTIYFGGTFVKDINSFDIDSSYNISNIKGNKISNVRYENGKILFDLNTAVTFDECNQFEFKGNAINAGNATYTIDNLIIDQLPTIESIELTTNTVKKTYYLGDEFDATNLLVKAYYTDNTTKMVEAKDYEISGFDSNTPGKQIITITYQNKTAFYKIDVLKKLINLEIDTTTVKKEFNIGEEFNFDGLVVTASFENKGSQVLEHNAFLDGYSISYGGFDSYKPGKYTITISYKDYTKSYEVEVLKSNNVTFDVTYE